MEFWNEGFGFGFWIWIGIGAWNLGASLDGRRRVGMGVGVGGCLAVAVAGTYSIFVAQSPSSNDSIWLDGAWALHSKGNGL